MYIFSKSITHAEDGRYTVAMPIIPNPPMLGNSLRAAMARQFDDFVLNFDDNFQLIKNEIETGFQVIAVSFLPVDCQF